MSGFIYEWIKKWNLSKDDFKDLPKGEKALVWALKNGKVDETAYVHWAKKYYKCPTIQSDFFNKSVKFELLKKFAGIYSWSSDCYPVHIWKGRLLVACLEPPEKLRANSKLCFAIAPFSAMDRAWKDHHKKENSKSVSETDFDFASLEKKSISLPQQVVERRKFSQEQTDITGEVEITREGEISWAEEVTKEQELAVLQNCRAEKDKVVKKEIIKKVAMKKETKIPDVSVQTLSGSKFFITDKDLFGATDINKCTGLRQVMSYIFYYLKEDYKKLMLVEYVAHDRYLPRLVYGDWQITDMAWEIPVNITDPNIFRIVYNSKHPFHGTIVDNDVNKKYYQWWTNNKRPDFATVYPFYYDQFLYGFLVCFDRTAEFDQNITLKKIKNLLSLSKPRFVDTYKHLKISS